MANPMIKIINTQTGEEIEREMNAEELASYEKSNAEDAANNTLLQELKNAKETATAKLTALGLTADDLKALGL